MVMSLFFGIEHTQSRARLAVSPRLPACHLHSSTDQRESLFSSWKDPVIAQAFQEVSLLFKSFRVIVCHSLRRASALTSIRAVNCPIDSLRPQAEQRRIKCSLRSRGSFVDCYLSTN